MGSITGLTPDEALEQIKDFAAQTGECMDPLGLQRIFQRTVYQDVRLPEGHVKGKFVIQEEGVEQPSKTTAGVEKLHETLKAVQGKPMSSQDAQMVNQITNQLYIFDRMEKARTAPAAPKQQPQVGGAPRSVQQLKDELKTKKISALKFPVGALLGGILGPLLESPMIAVCTIIAVAAITAGAASAGIAFAVLAGLGAVIGLGFLGLAIGALIYRGVMGRKFDKATTPEQMFPLYEDLTLEARIQFLLKLGPKFRADLLEWEKEHGGGRYTQSLCEFINNITSDTVPEDLKKQYYKDKGPNLLSEEPGYSTPVRIFDTVRAALESEGYAKKEWLAYS